MGCLDDLEKRLEIQPLEFKKDEELPSPSLNEYGEQIVDGLMIEQEYEIDKDLLNIEKHKLKEVAIAWCVPTDVVTTLYNHVKSIYKNQTTNNKITNLCETILYSISNNDVSKAYVNDLIKELNTLI